MGLALTLALAFAFAFGLVAPRRGEDLAKVYPGTLDWVQYGLDWRTSPEDVWELSSFEVAQGKELEISCKKATVVFGVHGTDVLWAVVFPDEACKIGGKVAGAGETTREILLRFAPKEIGRVFPKKTVLGRSEETWRRARAARIFRHKIGWKWSTPSGDPTVVQAGYVIVDADTEEGPRRLYGLDRAKGTVEVADGFASKPVPALAGVGKKEALDAFDQVWEAFDREYAKFVDLPDVDWSLLKKRYRGPAGEVHTVFDLAAVISDMLASLRDLHVWVRAGEDPLPGYTRERPQNASWKGSEVTAGAFRQAGKDLVWTRTEDGLGYVNVFRLQDPALPAAFDAVLESLADSWGLVLDLRFDGGGDEELAKELAGHFLEESAVYSKDRIRSGEAHDALGPELERSCEPRGPWRYAAPVVVLQGQRTMSSAESFALMLAQAPNVTTMGDRTAGSSGNPRLLELPVGISVNLPRWRDEDPDGNPIEGRGVAPDVPLAFDAGEYTDRADPLLAAALKRLRAIPASERAPAQR